MVVQTLELIHDGTDVVYAVAELYAHSLLDDAYKRMAVVHGAEIVQTVGESQCLWVCHRLHHLLHTAVNVSQMRIDALDGLIVDDGLQAEHTMCRRVVRTEVDDIVVGLEQTVLLLHELSEIVELPLRSPFRLRLVGHRELVVLRTHVVVLAQRIALEVSAQEQTSHVRVSEELYSEEVVDLTLQQVSGTPYIVYRRDDIVVADLFCHLLDADALMCVGILKKIYASEAFFLSEVLADNGNKVIEVFLVLELRHLFLEGLEAEFFKF